FAETHAYLPWVFELASHPRVLDAVEPILGPDLLIWDSRWFTKQPGDPTYITWHQDGTYWALDPPKACTAWIALSRSNEANGAMTATATSTCWCRRRTTRRKRSSAGARRSSPGSTATCCRRARRVDRTFRRRGRSPRRARGARARARRGGGAPAGSRGARGGR